MPRKSKPARSPVSKKSAAAATAKARPPAIVGEKRVKKTTATVPVGPARRKRGMHDGPTNPAALDRRRQVTGTDELR